MWASSNFIAKNRAGILGVSRLPQTIFLMACSADPWRTTDGLRFGTSPVSRQTNEALRPSDGNPEVIGWSVGLVLTDASAFSDATPDECSRLQEGVRRRVRKSRQKEAAGAADAGLMQIEWSETEGLKLAGVVKAATVAGGGSVQRRVDGRSEPRRGQEEDVGV